MNKIMKNIKYLLLLGMTLGIQLHGMFFVDDVDGHILTSRKRTLYNPSQECFCIDGTRCETLFRDQFNDIKQTEEGRIEFVQKYINRFFKKKSTPPVITTIEYIFVLDDENTITYTCTYNENSTNPNNFKQNSESIVKCFEYYQSAISSNQSKKPCSYYLKSMKIVNESNTELNTINHTTIITFFEDGKYSREYQSEISRPKKTYFTTRNLTLLALIAGGAAMYYTKTSPKDLITKLWSLTGATRKMLSKK